MLSDNLPTEFCLGPVGASVWCVGSAPGDSKERPGFKDVAPGPSVRAEAWLQSEEALQCWSSWIWTGEVSQLTSSV